MELVSLGAVTQVNEWSVAAEEIARWAEQSSRLVKQIDHLLPAIESVEQSKIAASLALSANEASGVKAVKLKRSAIASAQKAASLAQVVVKYLNQTQIEDYKDQARAWSRAIEIANRLESWSTLSQVESPSKKRWGFWQ